MDRFGLSLLILREAREMPYFAAYLLGIVLGLIHLRRHPRAARALLAGLGGLTCLRLVRFALPYYLLYEDWSPLRGPAAREVAFETVGLVTHLLSALVFGLVVLAVYVDRTRPADPPDAS